MKWLKRYYGPVCFATVVVAGILRIQSWEVAEIIFWVTALGGAAVTLGWWLGSKLP